MQKIIEGIYQNGSIILEDKYSFPENKKLKIIVLEEIDKAKLEKFNKEFPSYNFGQQLDSVNIREFAYED